MKKLLLTFLFTLVLSGVCYAEIISIVCVDEKRSLEENRDVSIKLSFDEAGNWISIGGQKFIDGTVKDAEGKIIKETRVDINVNEIELLHSDTKLDIYLEMEINRLNGAMSQKSFMVGKNYNFNYKCQKDNRAF
ncbi:hypothetical protein OAT43_00710 [Candidatus Pelagibacter ubique]|nr:hypothetical protein [Candidatus Pelagibacter ubique]